MRKAKDYAMFLIARSKECTDTDTTPLFEQVHKTLIDLLEEGAELQTIRHAKSAEAIYAIMKEQDNKWRSICRLVDQSGVEVLPLEEAFMNIVAKDPTFKIPFDAYYAKQQEKIISRVNRGFQL